MSVHCVHRPPCPGCPRFGDALGPELTPLQALARTAGIALERGNVGPSLGYRVRSRLAVRGGSQKPWIGIFEPGTHRAVHIPQCLVHHPLVNEIAASVGDAMRALHVEPYADRSHRGVVRYLQVVIERGSSSAQLVLAVNASSPAEYEPLCARLRSTLGSRLHSLFVSVHTARSNTILGPSCHRISGPEAVRERIAGAEVFFPPDAFGQANLGGYEHIVERIGALVAGDSDVLELYAGTGAIGLSLLPRVRRVRCNEVGTGSLRGLALGIAALPAAERARVEVLPGPVAQHTALAAGADVVIADPPRKGLDPGLLAELSARPPRQLLYLSCHVPSLVRDATALHQGGLTLCELVAYDLFPFTGHVETLARFERKS